MTYMAFETSNKNYFSPSLIFTIHHHTFPIFHIKSGLGTSLCWENTHFLSSLVLRNSSKVVWVLV